MMKVVTLSGSSRSNSSNTRLLAAIAKRFSKYEFQPYNALDQIPLFRAEDDKHPWPIEVVDFRKVVGSADAIIICTPEYIHNLPALLKNAMEWLASSGEFVGKPVLPITYTPNDPRGERAMQSMLWSLEALDARVVASMPLYQTELKVGDNLEINASEDVLEMLDAGVELLLKE